MKKKINKKDALELFESLLISVEYEKHLARKKEFRNEGLNEVKLNQAKGQQKAYELVEKFIKNRIDALNEL